LPARERHVQTSPLAERAAATLRSFGHPIGSDLAPALARADRVEVWT